MKLFTKSLIYTMAMLLFTCVTMAQTRTMGVIVNNPAKTYSGYTLFAPKQNTMTYLINNEGRMIHEWKSSQYAPGQSVYLLENGHLLRTCMTQGNLGTGGGEGGRIEEYTWNDSLVWFMNYSTSTYMQHHDIKRLPNGNIIMLVVEKKLLADIVQAGFDLSKFQPDVTQKGFMLPDGIVEIQPTYPSGGTVVWQWHVWDHLIQERDATKSNFGDVSAHPELIDVLGDHRILPLFWNHMNAIDYNPTFDQIAMSVRGNSEVWVIDHSTTTTEASSHTGGNRGKGGDLLYRWGNPQTYGAGTTANQTYFEQHDAEWIKAGSPGAGNILCFNNGVNRNYSSIDEITPPVDALGNYTINTGAAFAPTALSWTYKANPPSSMYALDISGAERMPNGNTIICVGPCGTLYEVNVGGEVVWEYINPVDNIGSLTQGDTIPHNPDRPDETMNSIFRIYRYAPDYAAFTGRDITPGDFIEKYASGIDDHAAGIPDYSAFPNPFINNIFVQNSTGKEIYSLSNVEGKAIWSGVDIEQQDFSALPKGAYLLKVQLNRMTKTLKLFK